MLFRFNHKRKDTSDDNEIADNKKSANSLINDKGVEQTWIKENMEWIE